MILTNKLNTSVSRKRIVKTMTITLLALSIASLAGCGGGGSGTTPTPAPTPTPPPAPTPTPTPAPTPQGNAGRGEGVFTTAVSGGNQFSCANCHSISEDANGLATADNLHRPAHPLFNVMNRSSFHNGNTAMLFDAVNICREDWQDATVFTESSQDWLDLEAYFQQESNSDAASNITSTLIDPITDFSSGDIAAGQTRFNETCATCHGENALGTNLAANLTTRVVSANRVSQKVRTSGPTTSSVFAGLTGGNMPFWSQERLSDENLANIAVYVDSVSPDSAPTQNCGGTDHTRVGQVANLSMLAHNVSGRAEIIDNCTIQVTNFNFDGDAPNVEFYGGVNGDYVNGFGISERIDGRVFTDTTFTIILDSPSVLDRMDGLSVWCVEFRADFGSGMFQ